MTQPAATVPAATTGLPRYARLQAELARRRGVVARAHCLDLGISPGEIRKLLRDGELRLLQRGVYVDGEVWDAADEYREQPLLRARGALLAMRRGWVLSHDSAAHALGLAVLAPAVPFVHVTRPGHTNAWTRGGVKHHLAGFAPTDVVEVDGLRVLHPARTAVDMAREHGEAAGVVTADSALRAGATRAQLWAATERMVSWPNVTVVRRVIDLADDGAESAAESLGRLFVTGLGIGTPETQFPLQLARGVVWCDLRVGRHVFEVHGLVKYRSVEDGGVATKPAAEVLVDERQRERLVVAEGLGLTNLYWRDFFGPAADDARTRALADYRNTVARFGTELPQHLAENAVRLRRLEAQRAGRRPA